MPYRPAPQQWQQQYPMHMAMGRGYPQYPPMNPYAQPQHYPVMRPSPHQHPSSSSVHSGQGLLSPSPANTSPYTPMIPPPQAPSPQRIAPAPPPAPRAPSPVPTRTTFYPPLPWQSFEGDFAAQKSRRRRIFDAQSDNIPVVLPPRPDASELSMQVEPDPPTKTEAPIPERLPSAGPPSLETPPTSRPPSEIVSTQPTTPSSVAPPRQITPKASSTAPSAVPAVSIRPAVPNIPLPARASKQPSGSVVSETTKPSELYVDNTGLTQDSTTVPEEAKPAPAKVAPKSWADLVRTKAAPASSPASSAAATSNGNAHKNELFDSKTSFLVDVLKSYNVKEGTDKISFLEPRGLVNTGNTCFMNSVLQILLFCVPFYAFLEKVGKQAVHSFKSDTPMMDAMIMFMREFKIIDATVSVEQLRMRLKDKELEQYGESFVPEFVYAVIRHVPRFASMRRGQQQDAEEFLGFLLEELHLECSRVLNSGGPKSATGASSPSEGVKSPQSSSSGIAVVDEGMWLEVGPKQRAAITRSSGAITTESPVTKIFGGNLRSELRIPGKKNSVTLEPYQPLQLDIGAPQVNNIVDALKNLTKPETLHGDFESPRGPGSTATKQVTIETLPEVLILHLKRFQYDNTGGAQKIWKKIGYPLDLEIPKEVFPQHKRGGLVAHGGLPKYRLVGVVYHHGKNAGLGHYTVDVRRQDGREWIRIDDTVIKRIRSDDVAAGGSEEDPKLLAKALEQHKNDQTTNKGGSVYDQFTVDEDEDQPKTEKPWSHVHENLNDVSAGKKRSAAVNGNLTPKASSSGKATPVGRHTSVKDNKVAYILFYQRL
ncbi:uncharacterized protein KY384_000305 [Bacidia gigantensis]|uniref:uncharacterized protein n=1 Tax=Bacidia gigantensis TaxID=2732470 RepID=UPI001D03DDE9|nr:uncharacterized protein KY384_000305 [Bacidia gigantensis]KAG8526312.1 hypothetical protein KY384_000305 [Bacidia gigantensis]